MGPGQTRHELNLIEAATAAGVSRVVKLSVWRADEELTPIAGPPPTCSPPTVTTAASTPSRAPRR
ncbi:hypothetical protein ACFQY7_19745 [Actinomadura luteofluorescens]|uniref:Uncharacterized protein n=1 Tax=Actinomadura luteofluorescens TaxID=46163 RepID=A0A7Y9JLF2_9ACTN|nr:hypothetical protein [Actinomadura luteofluorescens]NYD51444.1 hypothetical protein [Actinomadura luteofluorescens]